MPYEAKIILILLNVYVVYGIFLVMLLWYHLSREIDFDRQSRIQNIVDILFAYGGAALTLLFINAQPEPVKKYTRIFYGLSITLMVFFIVGYYSQ